MGSPIGRYEQDLKQLRSRAPKDPWYDPTVFEFPFCARAATSVLEQMSQHRPSSVTEMRAMLNQIGSVYATVTHGLTKDTKPGDDYLGPTNPHPRELRTFVLLDVVRGGLPVLLVAPRDREGARKAFEEHVKPLIHRAIGILRPLTEDHA